MDNFGTPSLSPFLLSLALELLSVPSWIALIQAESTGSQSQTIKSRYLIAIEDPFEISHNVARTVNQQGRFDIRGEFIRATKMLNTPHGRQQWLSDVCIERVLPERLPPRPRKPDAENVDTGLEAPEPVLEPLH